MKITLDQLRQHLDSLQNVYLVFGDEPLLVDETCVYLKQFLKKSDFHECVSYQVNASFNWQTLLAETQSLSLFSERKMIECDLSSGKPGKVGAQTLIDFTCQATADTVLLLKLPKLTITQQKSKWFKTLEQHGLAVQVWSIKPNQFPHWLRKRLQRVQLTTSTEGLNLLANLTEGNLLAAKQSVEKLALLYGAGEISVEQITACLSDSSYFDVYALLDACLERQIERALLVLDKLLLAKTEASLILWVLRKELLILVDLATAFANEQPTANVWKKHNVWQSRQQILRQHAKAFSQAAYWQCLQKVAQCERIIKGAETGDITSNLRDCVMGFSQPG